MAPILFHGFTQLGLPVGLASAARPACEYRIRLTSGEYLWVEDNGLPIDLMLR